MEHVSTLILETIPQEYHQQIKKRINEVGVIEALCRDVYSLWTEELKLEAMRQIFDPTSEGVFKIILVDNFKMQDTIQAYESHKKFIMKVYQRFRTFFQSLSLDQVEKHDLSKVTSFVELFGYTARFFICIKH